MVRQATRRATAIAITGSLLVVLALLAGADRGAAKPPPVGNGRGGAELTEVGSFNEPVYSATAPGKANRKLLFVVERGGTVRVVRNGNTLDQPFLDISERLNLGFNERGLLSITFDPDYAQNRRFYAYYTSAPDGDIVVEQFKRAADSKVLAESGSGREVISIPHGPYPNHNGGQVGFGPDGNMWLATGDGGFACDPDENAQNLDSLLGKLLRITPQKQGGYSVPKDNPFVKRAGADEIYSYGLRNPFRFSFDDDTRTLAIGDVGQDLWEEIDYAKISKASGANFGWDASEGYVPLELSAFCISGGGFTGGDTPTPLPDESTLPILAYPHSSGDPDQYTGCAVIGGPVVRDERLKRLYGRYLYSDSCSGGLQSLVPDTRGATGDRPTGLTIDSPSSITEGRKNRIYATSLAGSVYRLDPSSQPSPAMGAGASRHDDARVGDGGGAFRAKKLGNFKDPVYVTGPDGARGLRFVVEKAGKIKAVGPDGRTSTFLNISSRVADDGERGLLSVAFPPDYGQSGLLYIYYTDNRGDIVVAEFERSADNPRKARSQSGRRVIRIKHRLASNHNGGQVQFGPDGLLYLGTGDGGSGGDPDENAQSLDSLLGKLIRIDPRRSGKQPYTIPGSNPFVGAAGRDEIYSYGLRNPFRFSFDRQSGHLLIGDVGQDTWEEIDYVTTNAAGGANFGWDAFEGFDPFDSSDASPIPAGPVTPPIHQYKHVDGNCSITGGLISRDPRNPSLDGRYLYADFCGGEIRSLIPDDGGSTDDRPVGGLPSFGGIAGFGEDTKGRVYVADLGGGAVYSISRGK